MDVQSAKELFGYPFRRESPLYHMSGIGSAFCSVLILPVPILLGLFARTIESTRNGSASPPTFTPRTRLYLVGFDMLILAALYSALLVGVPLLVVSIGVFPLVGTVSLVTLDVVAYVVFGVLLVGGMIFYVTYPLAVVRYVDDGHLLKAGYNVLWVLRQFREQKVRQVMGYALSVAFVGVMIVLGATTVGGLVGGVVILPVLVFWGLLVVGHLYGKTASGSGSESSLS